MSIFHAPSFFAFSRTNARSLPVFSVSNRLSPPAYTISSDEVLKAVFLFLIAFCFALPAAMAQTTVFEETFPTTSSGWRTKPETGTGIWHIADTYVSTNPLALICTVSEDSGYYALPKEGYENFTLTSNRTYRVSVRCSLATDAGTKQIVLGLAPNTNLARRLTANVVLQTGALSTNGWNTFTTNFNTTGDLSSWTQAIPVLWAELLSTPRTAEVFVDDIKVELLSNLPPSAVSITSPNGWEVVNSPATIQATAYDPDNNIERVKFYSGTTYLGEDLTSPYSLSANLSPGTRSVKAVAIDQYGLSLESATRTFVINTAPTASSTAPADGAQYGSTSSVSLTATASDDDFNLAKVEFYVNGQKVGEDNTAPYAHSYSNSAGGQFTWHARAVDDLGLWGLSDDRTFDIAAPPSTSIISPQSHGTVGSCNVYIQAETNLGPGGILAMKFFRDDTLIGTDSISPYEYQASGWAAGTYLIEARGVDLQGNDISGALIYIHVEAAELVLDLTETNQECKYRIFGTVGPNQSLTLSALANATDNDDNPFTGLEIVNGEHVQEWGQILKFTDYSPVGLGYTLTNAYGCSISGTFQLHPETTVAPGIESELVLISGLKLDPNTGEYYYCEPDAANLVIQPVVANTTGTFWYQALNPADQSQVYQTFTNTNGTVQITSPMLEEQQLVLNAITPLGCTGGHQLTINFSGRQAPVVTVAPVIRYGGQPAVGKAMASGGNPPYLFTWSGVDTCYTVNCDSVLLNDFNNPIVVTVGDGTGCSISTAITATEICEQPFGGNLVCNSLFDEQSSLSNDEPGRIYNCNFWYTFGGTPDRYYLSSPGIPRPNYGIPQNRWDNSPSGTVGTTPGDVGYAGLYSSSDPGALNEFMAQNGEDKVNSNNHSVFYYSQFYARSSCATRVHSTSIQISLQNQAADALPIIKDNSQYEGLGNPQVWQRISAIHQLNPGNVFNVLVLGSTNPTSTGAIGLENQCVLSLDFIPGRENLDAYTFVDEVKLYEIPHLISPLCKTVNQGSTITMQIDMTGEQATFFDAIGSVWEWIEPTGNVIGNGTSLSLSPTKSGIYKLRVTIGNLVQVIRDDIFINVIPTQNINVLACNNGTIHYALPEIPSKWSYSWSFGGLHVLGGNGCAENCGSIISDQLSLTTGNVTGVGTYSVVLFLGEMNECPTLSWDVKFKMVNQDEIIPLTSACEGSNNILVLKLPTGGVAENYVWERTIDEGINWINVATADPFNFTLDENTPDGRYRVRPSEQVEGCNVKAFEFNTFGENQSYSGNLTFGNDRPVYFHNNNANIEGSLSLIGTQFFARGMAAYNLNLPGGDVTGSTLTIKPGGTLLVSNLARLQSACQNMWGGIKMENATSTSRPTVDIQNSFIEDAYEGISSGKDKLDVKNTLFKNCMFGIKAHSGPETIIIANNIVSNFQEMKAPFDFERNMIFRRPGSLVDDGKFLTEIGLTLNSIGPDNFSMQYIGNYFSNVAIGMVSESDNAEIQGNYFNDCHLAGIIGVGGANRSFHHNDITLPGIGDFSTTFQVERLGLAYGCNKAYPETAYTYGMFFKQTFDNVYHNFSFNKIRTHMTESGGNQVGLSNNGWSQNAIYEGDSIWDLSFGIRVAKECHLNIRKNVFINNEVAVGLFHDEGSNFGTTTYKLDLKCNTFTHETSSGTSRKGLVIGQNVVVGSYNPTAPNNFSQNHIGGTNNFEDGFYYPNANVWPTAQEDKSIRQIDPNTNEPVNLHHPTLGWHDPIPSSWLPIENNSGISIAYYRYDNEFVKNNIPQLVNVTFPPVSRKMATSANVVDLINPVDPNDNQYAFACDNLDPQLILFPARISVISSIESRGYSVALNDEPFLGNADPNPCSDETRVEINLPDNLESVFFQVLEIGSGKVLQNFRISERGKLEVLLDSRKVPSSTYIYRLILDGHPMWGKKIIIQH